MLVYDVANVDLSRRSLFSPETPRAVEIIGSPQPPNARNKTVPEEIPGDAIASPIIDEIDEITQHQERLFAGYDSSQRAKRRMDVRDDQHEEQSAIQVLAEAPEMP